MSRNILHEQLSKANEEYQALKIEKGKIVELWEKNEERIRALREGTVSEDFEGEKARLLLEQDVLKSREGQAHEKMLLWITVKEECTRVLHSL